LRLNNSSPQPEAGWLAMPRPPCLLSGSLGPRHGPCWLAWQGQDLRDCPLRFVGFHVDLHLLSEPPSALGHSGALDAKCPCSVRLAHNAHFRNRWPSSVGKSHLKWRCGHLFLWMLGETLQPFVCLSTLWCISVLEPCAFVQSLPRFWIFIPVSVFAALWGPVPVFAALWAFCEKENICLVL
jgi:hypothetical protein